MPLPRRSPWTERMVGASPNWTPTCGDVEADTAANGQAAGVVALVAVAKAIGAIGEGSLGLVTGVVSALVGWLIWAGWSVFDRGELLRETPTWGELVRTLGFARSARRVVCAGDVPVVGGVVRFAVTIWILIAGVIAIRQALDVGAEKAVLTAVLGWLALALPSSTSASWGPVRCLANLTWSASDHRWQHSAAHCGYSRLTPMESREQIARVSRGRVLGRPCGRPPMRIPPPNSPPQRPRSAATGRRKASAALSLACGARNSRHTRQGAVGHAYALALLKIGVG